jgi:polar amino acid transport system substrate-binding protein
MKNIALLAFLALVLAFGCVSETPPAAGNNTMVGNDSDAHGCRASAGYSWCEEKQKCIRPWEENCTKPLRIITEEFPPYNFMDSSGAVSGISTDIVRELIKRTGAEGNIELMEWSKGYSLAEKGPATVIYSVARIPEREGKFKWVGPVGVWKPTFYERAGGNITITSLEDARQAGKVCVVEQDARHHILMENNFTDVDTVASDGECARMLQEGKVALWFGSDTSIDGILAKENLSESDFRPVYDVMNNPLYIAFSNDVPDAVVSDWQEKLGDMYNDGTYANISAKYDG